MRPAAFTLVELLVVITIIVILLALLAPALDRAVYAAELAVCGTNQHGIVAGLHAYAHDNRRFYPPRPVARARRDRPTMIAAAFYAVSRTDDRSYLRPYISINKQLQCPLTGRIDMDGADLDTSVLATYALWYSFYWETGIDKAMFKLGDRFTYAGEPYSLLVSDWDGNYTGNNSTVSTHQDRDGVMFNYVTRNEPNPTNQAKWTVSLWHSGLNNRRGPIDRNDGYDDGSVRRTSDIAAEEGDPSLKNTERFIWAPQYANLSFPQDMVRMPRLK